MKKTTWIISYILSFVLAVSLAGYVGFTKSMQLLMAPAPAALAATVVAQPMPSYDATKPTVAILLGNTLSEPTDVLGPYAIFAESGAYNVYAVASSRTVRTLTGGLDVVPQLSFAELAARLHGSPDILVVPQIVDIRSSQNQPVVEWVKQQGRGQTLLFSWCTGAEVLAESGLIDGKSATAHWGDIGRLEGVYPAVRWQRGMRYVDAGTVLTTGGLTAGIDGTLHLLERRNGQAVAAKVAQALHIPPSPFVANPRLTQYQFTLADSILLLNFAFHWPKRHTCVWLYDGIGELDLGSVADVYAASSTDQIYTVADAASVVSRHGLQFVPRWQVRNLPAMDRLLVPGGDGAGQAANRLPSGLRGAGVPVKKLQNDKSPEYAYGAALEDLALHQDIPTAMFAAKRLEVRSALHLVGPKWPIRVILAPLLPGCIALGCALWLSRLVQRRSSPPGDSKAASRENQVKWNLSYRVRPECALAIPGFSLASIDEVGVRAMDEEHLRIAFDALRTELLPRLVGRVFHVTTRDAYVRIQSDGAIKSNQSGELGFTFGQSEFSYFRKRGCVSVFDLRAVTPDQLEDGLRKYYFLNPDFSKSMPVFLLLKDSRSEHLIPWSESILEEGARAMVIPYVEAGYPGEIALSLVERALLLEVPAQKPCAECTERLFAVLAEDATPDDGWTCANCGAEKPNVSLLHDILLADEKS